jgi:uncharacterized iron-regulated membrane protein
MAWRQTWLRRALFQVHLWSGIAIGLYVLLISVTGSVLVYRNELYREFTRQPVITKVSGARLSDDQIKAAVMLDYPGFRIASVSRPPRPDEAVDVRLELGRKTKNRLFDPRTGTDLGDSVPTGIRVVSWLIDLHDNLLAGPKGREVNGLGALALLVLGFTGMAIWWSGAKNWKRGLTLHPGVGWKRLTWDLHSAMGFWSVLFLIVFGLSGIYLAIPDRVQDLADWIEPLTPANMTSRVTDRIIYWLAYLHFGRINGIGIPCKGRGLCDQATKATWALFGIAPAAMFVTGGIMWWNRVLRKRF